MIILIFFGDVRLEIYYQIAISEAQAFQLVIQRTLSFSQLPSFKFLFDKAKQKGLPIEISI